MTPEELKDRAAKIQVIESELRILNSPKPYIVVDIDDEKGYIRTSGGTGVCLDKEDLAILRVLANTFRSTMIEKRKQEIEDLCNG